MEVPFTTVLLKVLLKLNEKAAGTGQSVVDQLWPPTG